VKTAQSRPILLATTEYQHVTDRQIDGWAIATEHCIVLGDFGRSLIFLLATRSPAEQPDATARTVRF